MNDALSIARDLIRCPSVTPAEAGALGVLENILKTAGFGVHRTLSRAPEVVEVRADHDVLVAERRVDLDHDVVVIRPGGLVMGVGRRTASSRAFGGQAASSRA